jgi:hypothetical protein
MVNYCLFSCFRIDTRLEKSLASLNVKKKKIGYKAYTKSHYIHICTPNDPTPDPTGLSTVETSQVTKLHN